MTTLSLVLPVIGQPDSTEDPKLNTALTAIQTWANGNIDATNLASAIAGAWTVFTPTWKAGGTAVTLGNGTLAGAYWQLGKTVAVLIQVYIGSTTNQGTGAWTFAVPVTPPSTGLNQSCGGIYYNGSTYIPISGLVGTAAITPYDSNAAVSSATGLTAGCPLTLQGVYQAA